jgi:hypothetical protein
MKFSQTCFENCYGGLGNTELTSTLKFFDNGVTCDISIVCLRTISIAPNHTWGRKQIVFETRWLCNLVQWKQSLNILVISWIPGLVSRLRLTRRIRIFCCYGGFAVAVERRYGREFASPVSPFTGLSRCLKRQEVCVINVLREVKVNVAYLLIRKKLPMQHCRQQQEVQGDAFHAWHNR